MNRVDKVTKNYLKGLNDVFLFDMLDEEYRILVTHVRVSADLKFIKCYFRILGVTDEKILNAVRKSLKMQKGRIRHLLAQRVFSKYAPEIVFVVDDFEYEYES